MLKPRAIALGVRSRTSKAPTGRNTRRHVNCAPLGLRWRSHASPGLSPWALTLRTFGAEYKSATSKRASDGIEGSGNLDDAGLNLRREGDNMPARHLVNVDLLQKSGQRFFDFLGDLRRTAV